jgi:hypothetical protein
MRQSEQPASRPVLDDFGGGVRPPASPANAHNSDPHLSGVAKRFELMARNPGGNWTISDIETACRENGLISFQPPWGSDSHWKISSPYLDGILTVPARMPIKPLYIRAFVGFVRKSREAH